MNRPTALVSMRMTLLVLVMLMGPLTPFSRSLGGPLAAGPGPSIDPLAALEAQLQGPRSPAPLPSSAGHLFPEPHHHPHPHIHDVAHDWLAVFRQDFMQRAVGAGLLAGAMLSWLGVFVVLRRMVFVGVSLAQVASAGVALGVLTGINPIGIAMAFMVIFSTLAGALRNHPHTSPEARIGLAYLIGGSVALLLLAQSGTGEAEQLEMLQGSLLTIPAPRRTHLTLAAIAMVAFHMLGTRKLLAVSFDPLTARVAGLNVRGWNSALFLALGVAIGVSLQCCGLLLVFGYLLIPAATGLLTRGRIPAVMVTAQMTQCLGTILGLWLAYELDLPPGPSIVVTMALILIVVAALAPRLAKD